MISGIHFTSTARAASPIPASQGIAAIGIHRRAEQQFVCRAAISATNSFGT